MDEIDARIRRPQPDAGHLRDYLAALLGNDGRLIVASNRGPLSFSRTKAGAWSAKRGSGGLVTALVEMGRLAPVTWVSAAMHRDDRAAAAALASGNGTQRALLNLIER